MIFIAFIFYAVGFVGLIIYGIYKSLSWVCKPLTEPQEVDIEMTTVTNSDGHEVEKPKDDPQKVILFCLAQTLVVASFYFQQWSQKKRCLPH